MTQAFNLALLANNLNTSGQLDATDGLSGLVPLANGGTGATNTVNSIVAGTGITTSVSGTAVTINSSGGVASVNGLTGAAVIPRGMQLFFTTTNWTAPAGVVRVKIYAVGGSQGGSNLPAGGTAGIVSLGVYAPGGVQNQQPNGIGGTYNQNIGNKQGITFRLYTGGSGCCGDTFYGQGGSNGGLVIGYATTVPGTVYSVTAGASYTGNAPGFCWLEW